jgi:hypothetical protein
MQDAGDDELVRPRVEPGGEAERIFGAEADRRGWGRASITLNTHPLHRLLPIGQADLVLPNGQNPLQLAGDCLVVGALFAAIAYFPLLMVALATKLDLRLWIGAAMGGAGVVGALYVFLRAWSPDPRDLDRF